MDSFCTPANTPVQNQGLVPPIFESKEELAGRMVGRSIDGRYRIQELIGQGGMGAVYKALQISLDKTVAIKILWPELAASQSSLKRFQQEAKAASGLSHPGLVAMYDYGLTDVGAPYLVMQYAQGKSLDEVLQDERHLSTPRTLDIFIQVCDALSYAHGQGVIHRDVKPGNIILNTAEGGADIVQIVDFGIAKVLSELKQEQALTQHGEVFGSPFYMSPEQCVADHIDQRSDIYSVSCAMFETLTGEPPFEGQHAMQTMYKHVNERPNFHRFKELKIPCALQSVLEKGLEKARDERYQTVDELKQDLVLIKRHGALPFNHLRGWLRGNPLRRRLVIYPLAALLACWLGFTIALWHAISALMQPPPWKQYIDQGNAQASVGNTDMAEQCYLHALSVANQTGAADTIKGSILMHIGDVYNDLADVQRDPHFEQQALLEYQAATSLGIKEPRLEAELYVRIGDAHIVLESPGSAVTDYETALDIRKKLDGKDSYQISALLLKLTRAYIASGSYEHARAALLDAVAIQKRILLYPHPDIALRYSLAAQLSEATNDYKKAVTYYERAIFERERLNSSQVEPLRELLLSEASLLRKMDRSEAAAQLEERAANLK